MGIKEKDVIYLGKCLAPHGIKGGFRFLLENTNDSALQKDTNIQIETAEKRTLNFQIRDISFGNRVIVYLQGISNRNQVEELLPFDIYITREDFPESEELYLNDLIGMEVFDYNTPSVKIGVCEKLYSNGVQDILVYRLSNGEKRELPLVDHFFPEISLESNKIFLKEPEIID